MMLIAKQRLRLVALSAALAASAAVGCGNSESELSDARLARQSDAASDSQVVAIDANPTLPRDAAAVIDAGAVVAGDSRNPIDAANASIDGPLVAIDGPLAPIDAGATSVDATVDFPIDTIIDVAPNAFTNDATVHFEFHATRDATFLCQQDHGLPFACSSPLDRTLSGQGRHSLSVAATALDGTVDHSPANAIWTLDTVAPDISFTTTPAQFSSATAISFAFASSDQSATFTCSLDNSTFVSCASPWSVSALDGLHSITIAAVDAAGNIADLQTSWTVETGVPNTVIDSPPADQSGPDAAVVLFSSPDAGPDATFTCSLDSSAPFACASPWTFANLAPGLHSIAVSATNAAGTPDPSPAVASWTTARGPYCGDGVVDPGECCDDGNSIDNDACSNSCRTNFVVNNGISAPPGYKITAIPYSGFPSTIRSSSNSSKFGTAVYVLGLGGDLSRLEVNDTLTSVLDVSGTAASSCFDSGGPNPYFTNFGGGTTALSFGSGSFADEAYTGTVNNQDVCEVVAESAPGTSSSALVIGSNSTYPMGSIWGLAQTPASSAYGDYLYIADGDSMGRVDASGAVAPFSSIAAYGMIFGQGDAYGTSMYAVDRQAGRVASLTPSGVASTFSTGVSGSLRDLAWGPGGAWGTSMYVSTVGGGNACGASGTGVYRVESNGAAVPVVGGLFIQDAGSGGLGFGPADYCDALYVAAYAYSTQALVVKIQPPSPTCGDGVVDPCEECDDGNQTPGDGCDSGCFLEP